MATILTREGKQMIVRVQVEFFRGASAESESVSDSDFATHVRDWAANAQAFWNLGAWPTGGEAPVWLIWDCPLRFEFVAQVGKGTAGWHQIEVTWEDGAGTHVAMGDGDLAHDFTGLWEYRHQWIYIAHEFGHLLALCDEYLSDAELRHPVASDSHYCIMRSVNTASVVKEVHVWDIADDLGGGCRFDGCKTVLDLLRGRGRARPIGRKRRPPPPAAPRPAGLSLEALFELDGTGRPLDFPAAVLELCTRTDLERARIADHLGDPSPWRRAAAAILAGSASREDLSSELLVTLRDPDERVRVWAARSLLRRGRDEGIPTLIAAMHSDAAALRHPPELLRSYANHVLERYAGTSVGFDALASRADRSDAIQRWQRWADTR